MTWFDVAARLADMEARGVLAPKDRPFLEDARARAAAADAD